MDLPGILAAHPEALVEATLHQSIVNRRPSLTYLALFGVVCAFIWLRWGGIRRGIWVDVDVYTRGAAAVMNHEPLYAVSVHDLLFTYSPFAAVLFAPLEVLGEVGARWGLSVVSIACYAVVVVVCARRLQMKPAVAGLVGLAGLTFEPLVRNMLLGQINLVLAALVVVDCFVVPARYRGIVIGVAAGVKLVPGAFILYLALKREWGAVLRCAVGFAGTVGLGAILAPRDSWQFWTGGFINLSRFGAAAMIGGDNQSLNAAFMRLSRDLTPPRPLMLLLSFGVLALGLVAARHQIASGHDVSGLVCIAFASSLASPISWTHHWVWGVPALLVLVQSRRRVAASLLGMIFLIGPMWLAPRGHFRELTHTWWQATACVSYVLIGLTFVTFFAMSTSRRSESSHSPV